MIKTKVAGLILILAALVGVLAIHVHRHAAADLKQAPAVVSYPKPSPMENLPLHACDRNPLPKLIIVTTGHEHLWACSGHRIAHEAWVVTGRTKYGEQTKPGFFKISAKLTNQHIKGCDKDGCWDHIAHYLIQYTNATTDSIGLVDASWRNPMDFGNLPPASNRGSRGAIDMKLTDIKWLYNWAPVGTTIKVET